MSKEFVCPDCRRHRIISINDDLTYHCPYCRIKELEGQVSVGIETHLEDRRLIVKLQSRIEAALKLTDEMAFVDEADEIREALQSDGGSR